MAENYFTTNRITKLEQIAQPLVVRFFCGTAERRKLAFVSDDGAQKNGICVSRMPICFSFDDGPRRKGKSLAEA